MNNLTRNLFPEEIHLQYGGGFQIEPKEEEGFDYIYVRSSSGPEEVFFEVVSDGRPVLRISLEDFVQKISRAPVGYSVKFTEGEGELKFTQHMFELFSEALRLWNLKNEVIHFSLSPLETEEDKKFFLAVFYAAIVLAQKFAEDGFSPTISFEGGKVIYTTHSGSGEWTFSDTGEIRFKGNRRSFEGGNPLIQVKPNEDFSSFQLELCSGKRREVLNNNYELMCRSHLIYSWNEVALFVDYYAPTPDPANKTEEETVPTSQGGAGEFFEEMDRWT